MTMSSMTVNHTFKHKVRNPRPKSSRHRVCSWPGVIYKVTCRTDKKRHREILPRKTESKQANEQTKHLECGQNNKRSLEFALRPSPECACIPLDDGDCVCML